VRSNRWSVIGLVALALVTAALVALSFLNLRPQQQVDAVPVANAPRLTEPTPTPSPVPSPVTSREPRESTMANIRTLLAGDKPVKIVVIGDGTGADFGSVGDKRWARLWAESLAAQRAVSIRLRQDSGDYGPPTTVSSKATAPIEFYNASDRPGRLADITRAADRLIPADADLVIINVGHNEADTDLGANLDAFWKELPTGSMGLVMVQNPQNGQGARAHRLRTWTINEWAERNRVPFVDVYTAFIRAPEPLTELLLADSTNPSPRGAEVWRDALLAALR
jgi:lysophospholipase L1-like esterase